MTKSNRILFKVFSITVIIMAVQLFSTSATGGAYLREPSERDQRPKGAFKSGDVPLAIDIQGSPTIGLVRTNDGLAVQIGDQQVDVEEFIEKLLKNSAQDDCNSNHLLYAKCYTVFSAGTTLASVFGLVSSPVTFPIGVLGVFIGALWGVQIKNNMNHSCAEKFIVSSQLMVALTSQKDSEIGLAEQIVQEYITTQKSTPIEYWYMRP